MPRKLDVEIVGYHDSTGQQMRFALAGGGPSGLEVVVQSTAERGLEVKFWHPFNHEWVTLNQSALKHHGNTLVGHDARKDTGNPETRWVEVHTDLLAQLGEWSDPVRIKVLSDKDGQLELAVRRAEEID